MTRLPGRCCRCSTPQTRWRGMHGTLLGTRQTPLGGWQHLTCSPLRQALAGPRRATRPALPTRRCGYRSMAAWPSARRRRSMQPAAAPRRRPFMRAAVSAIATVPIRAPAHQRPAAGKTAMCTVVLRHRRGRRHPARRAPPTKCCGLGSTTRWTFAKRSPPPRLTARRPRPKQSSTSLAMSRTGKSPLLVYSLSSSHRGARTMRVLLLGVGAW